MDAPLVAAQRLAAQLVAPEEDIAAFERHLLRIASRETAEVGEADAQGAAVLLELWAVARRGQLDVV